MGEQQKEFIIWVAYLVLPAALLRISSEFIPNIIISAIGAFAGFSTYQLLKQKSTGIKIAGLVVLVIVAATIVRLTNT